MIFKKIDKWQLRGVGDDIFEARLRKDMKALSDYSDALDSMGEVWSEAEIKRATIAKGSSEVQKWAQDNFDLIEEGQAVDKLFASESRINRYARSISSSFMGSVNALRLYIDGAEKAGLSQQELTDAIEKADPVLAEYINAHKKADLSVGNYIWQTKKATIQAGLFTAGISLGTAALGLLAQKGNTTAAQVVGGLTAVGGAIAGVVSAIQLAKGALELTTGFGIISAGISAVIAGISAFQTASARMREAWQADIDQLEQFKQSSEELTEAYTNVSKYLTALKNGEDVGDDLNDAVTALNKALGDNKVKFDEASISAEEYAKRIKEASVTSLKESLSELIAARVSADQKIKSKTTEGLFGLDKGECSASSGFWAKADEEVEKILADNLKNNVVFRAGEDYGLLGKRYNLYSGTSYFSPDAAAPRVLEYYQRLKDTRDALIAASKTDTKAYKVAIYKRT